MSKYYICEEKAFAPGIADGWPKIIKAPHTRNGRLRLLSSEDCLKIDSVLFPDAIASAKGEHE